MPQTNKGDTGMFYSRREAASSTRDKNTQHHATKREKSREIDVAHLFYPVPVLELALVLPGRWLVKAWSSNFSILPESPQKNCLVHGRKMEQKQPSRRT